MSAVLGPSSSSFEVLTSDLYSTHIKSANEGISRNSLATAANLLFGALEETFRDTNGIADEFHDIRHRMTSGSISSVRRVELELLQAGKSSMWPATFFNRFVPQVRWLCSPLYEQESESLQRPVFHQQTITLIEAILSGITEDHPDLVLRGLPAPGAPSIPPQFLDGFAGAFGDGDAPLLSSLLDGATAALAEAGFDGSDLSNSTVLPSLPSSVPTLPGTASLDKQKAEPSSGYELYGCELCSYRPKGDPKWFRGSLAKHMKLQQSDLPPTIYKCEYPGCNSQYKNRFDNLMQHKMEKNHFTANDATDRRARRRPRQPQQEQQIHELQAEDSLLKGGEILARPSKRKKMSE